MNKGLKALKKTNPEVYKKIMGMSNGERAKMAAKGMKIIKQYFSGGAVPHATYDPIGMQAQQRAGMQNFVNAAANAEVDRKKEKIETPKPEDMKEMSSMTIAEVPGAMDNDGLRASGAAPGLITGGPSAGPAKMTIPRSGTGGSGMGQLEMGGGMAPIKMSEGGKYAENGKKNEEDKKAEETQSAQEALAAIARQNPGIEVSGSTSDTAKALGRGLDFGGYTTAVDATAAPIRGIYVPPGEPAQREPEPTPTRPEGLSPMRTLKAGLPQSGLPKELMGGIREIQTPTGPKYTFDFSGISSYGGTPESGHVAGSASSGSSYDESRAGQIGGLQVTGYEDGRRLAPGEIMGGRTGSAQFYLPGATGVPLYQDSAVNLMGGSSPITADIDNALSMDTGKYRNITDIYDLYGEDAYMSALGELQKRGVDIDKFDLPIEFDRPSMYDPNRGGLGSGLGKTSSDVVRSRASRSTDGRVVSGTGELGAPAFVGGTGKRATTGSGSAEQKRLIEYFERKARQAAEQYGPNSKEAKAAEDMIAQNFGSGGKMYGGGGMRPLKSYGYGGKY